MHNLVALLPMKANSERVKGKNFRELNGKPLYRWILDTLLSIDVIDKVIINTDAIETFEKNQLPDNPKIMMRNRREEIRGDMVSMNVIIKDDIEAVASKSYLMTHATNPALGANTIRRAIETYQKGLQSGKDSLFTVNKMQTRFYREDGSPINHNPEELLRTQDLEPYYEENSNMYLFTRESFAKADARIGANPILFETPRIESIDIDDEEGWKIAEAITYYQLNH